jgi:hypothetical protein
LFLERGWNVAATVSHAELFLERGWNVAATVSHADKASDWLTGDCALALRLRRLQPTSLFLEVVKRLVVK